MKFQYVLFSSSMKRQMQFAVRGLLLYIALVSVSLTLTKAPFVFGGVTLIAIVAIANLVLPARLWRYLAYGAIVGMMAGVMGLVFYDTVVIRGARTYTDGRLEAVLYARPYLIQIGALVGGTVGYILSRFRSTKPEADERNETNP